jgi:hypothetical protein
LPTTSLCGHDQVWVAQIAGGLCCVCRTQRVFQPWKLNRAAVERRVGSQASSYQTQGGRRDE